MPAVVLGAAPMQRSCSELWLQQFLSSRSKTSLSRGPEVKCHWSSSLKIMSSQCILEKEVNSKKAKPSQTPN